MSVFNHPDFDQHESVHHFHHRPTGLQAIVAIHSTVLGPAAGGCRRWRYASAGDALTDALRLSRGMSYKNAIAGLPFGGGKAVMHAGGNEPPTPELFRAFGRAVASLDGRYVTAEDVGVTVEDMQQVRRETEHVSGITQSGERAGGDPSPWTALGVYLGIRAGVEFRRGVDRLEGLRIAVQGVGNVGRHLCRLLHDAGASLLVADVNEDNLRRLRETMPVSEVAPAEILFSDADVLAPCALGGILTAETIPRIRATVVAGAANNQLATEADGARLAGLGILYAPDYVVNAGGIVSVAREYLGGSSAADVRAEVSRIPERLRAIFEQAASSGKPTNLIADETARRLIAAGGARAERIRTAEARPA